MLSTIFSGVIGPLLVGAGIGFVSPLTIVGGIASAFWLKAILGKHDKDAK